jgi:hypothetical protein
MSLIGDFDRELTATTREIDQRAKPTSASRCCVRSAGSGATPRC